MTDVPAADARILIVEDERIVAEDVARQLHALGYAHTEVVTTGEQAVSQVAGIRPDLVLMDVRLAGEMDGIDAAERIRETARVPVVYLTAYADEHTLARAKATHPYGYVIKPFEPQALQTAIEMALHRHRAETALRRSEANFRTLIERAPVAVAVHRDGDFLYVNPKGLSVLGYTEPSDLVGTPVIDLIHPDDREVVAERIAQVTAGREDLPSREDRFLHRDGSVRVLDALSIRIEYDGRPALVAFAQDVTDRKRMEVQLALADRMATVGTLAAGVAHEISNPLTYALHNLDRLTEDLPRLLAALEGGGGVGAQDPVAFLRGLVERARRAGDGANRVRAIVRDLKTFSRVDEERAVPVSVNQAVEAALNMAHNEIKYRAQVVNELGSVPLVVAGEGRLSQVFLNLLVNAAHAIDEGRVAQNRVTVRSWAEGDEVVVEVADTGHGIPGPHLSRLFEPFFTTKPPGVGSGLGLSICQNIVRTYGGRIDVESTEGRGSTFRVHLPAADRGAVSQAAGGPRTPTPPPVRSRLLIVDDEPNIGVTLKNLLGLEHDVHLARSGAEAVSFLEADDAIDVILCDLMMADLSGMEFHAWLTERDPDLAARMILMTGGAFTQGARAFLERVENPRVEKPFKLDHLTRLIARVIGERGRRSAGDA